MASEPALAALFVAAADLAALSARVSEELLALADVAEELDAVVPVAVSGAGEALEFSSMLDALDDEASELMRALWLELRMAAGDELTLLSDELADATLLEGVLLWLLPLLLLLLALLLVMLELEAPHSGRKIHWQPPTQMSFSSHSGMEQP